MPGREIRAVLREGFVLALMLLVFFSALERGAIDTTAEAGAAPLLGPICHADAGSPAGQLPGAPVGHNCCDECALATAVLVPDAPVLAEPPAYSVAAPFAAGVQVAFCERSRTPKQSQGPPAVLS